MKRISDTLALTQMHNSMKYAFGAVKEEMEEHLQSINENTSEINDTADHLVELDSRLDKMEQRMEEIHMMFRQIINTTKISVDLHEDEQKIFVILYTHDSFLSAEDMATKFNLSARNVTDCLLSMSDKGVPIEKEMLNNEQYFKLESEFKALQAKEQIVKISPSVTQSLQNTLLNKFL